ncbi:MAG: hypothetical protein AAFR38_09260 [Planctomycetota bacterium]
MDTLLREQPEPPAGMADRVLAEVAIRRGFLAKQQRRRVRLGRLAMAASLVLAAGGVFLGHRMAPELFDLQDRPTPVGDLENALAATASMAGATLAEAAGTPDREPLVDPETLAYVVSSGVSEPASAVALFDRDDLAAIDDALAPIDEPAGQRRAFAYTGSLAGFQAFAAGEPARIAPVEIDVRLPEPGVMAQGFSSWGWAEPTRALGGGFGVSLASFRDRETTELPAFTPFVAPARSASFAPPVVVDLEPID